MYFMNFNGIEKLSQFSTNFDQVFIISELFLPSFTMNLQTK